MTALTVERGRSHHLEPPGVADRMIDHVAATCAVPGMSDTNLPVASAVPIVTDAVGASTVTAKRAALTSSRNHSDRTNASQQNVPNAQHRKVSLEELLRREKERGKTSHASKPTNAANTTSQRHADRSHTHDVSRHLTLGHQPGMPCNKERQKAQQQEQGPADKSSKERDRQEWIDAHGLADTRDFFAGMDARMASKSSPRPRLWGQLSAQERRWKRKEEASSKAAQRELHKRHGL